MAVETNGGAPKPPRQPGDSGRGPERRGPRGRSLTALPAPDEVLTVPHYVDTGPMHRVYLGPPGAAEPDGAFLTLSSVPGKLIDPRTPYIRPTVLEPVFIGEKPENGRPATVVRPRMHDQPVRYSVLAEELAAEEAYEASGTKSIVTLVGRNTARAAFRANRDTLELMARGDIPTPDELAPVVAAYRESRVRGREAFEDFYTAKLLG